MTDPTALRALFAKIAAEHLDIHDFERRNNDGWDFHSVAVWEIERALAAAYEAGFEAAKKEGGRG